MNIFYPNLTQGGKAQYAGRGYGTWAGAMRGYENKQAEEEKARRMQKAEHETGRNSKALSAAHAAKKLGEVRNQSEDAKALSGQAHALSMRASDNHSHRMAGNAHHDAARVHLHEGNSDLADAHFAAAKAHFKAAPIGQAKPNTGYAKVQAHRDAAER